MSKLFDMTKILKQIGNGDYSKYNFQILVHSEDDAQIKSGHKIAKDPKFEFILFTEQETNKPNKLERSEHLILTQEEMKSFISDVIHGIPSLEDSFVKEIEDAYKKNLARIKKIQIKTKMKTTLS